MQERNISILVIDRYETLHQEIPPGGLGMVVEALRQEGYRVDLYDKRLKQDFEYDVILADPPPDSVAYLMDLHQQHPDFVLLMSSGMRKGTKNPSITQDKEGVYNMEYPSIKQILDFLETIQQQKEVQSTNIP